MDLSDANDRPTLGKGWEGRVNKQLIDLRTRGMNNPEVADLTELQALAEYLVPEEALAVVGDTRGRYWDGNHDVAVRRIEVLLECAIGGWDDTDDVFQHPGYSEVVRLWFGLDPSTRKLGQAQRHERARSALPNHVEPRTFKNSYARKFKEQLGSRLATRYRDELPFTLAETSCPRVSFPPAANESEEPPARTRRVGHRVVVVGSGLALLCCALAVAAVLGFGSSGGDGQESPAERPGRFPTTEVPPRRTIINATTGEADFQPERQPPDGEIRLTGGGPIFRACDFTREPECPYRAGQFHVALGDNIRFLFVLDNTGKTPLPYARFSVNFQNSVGVPPNAVRAEYFISWPGNHDEAAHLTSKKPHIIFFSKGEPIYIRYLPGSTKLLPLDIQRFLTYLPDGIATLYGIGLTHIGSPSRCFINCSGRYIRFVQFQGEVVR